MAAAAWGASCRLQLQADKHGGVVKRSTQRSSSAEQRSAHLSSDTPMALRSIGAAPGSVWRSVPQRQGQDASDSPACAAPAPSCFKTALISASLASSASAVPSTTAPGPQSMASTAWPSILLSRLSSEFAAALSQQSSSAAALSSAAAALGGLTMQILI